jgi:hypothetical protein
MISAPIAGCSEYAMATLSITLPGIRFGEGQARVCELARFQVRGSRLIRIELLVIK